MTTDDLINQRLGQYEIKSLLGRGGMAAVYLARQTSMNRDVAIKVMSRELADDEQFVTRFEHEAQLIAKLQHPHILPVIDFGRQDKRIYIVMQVVRGGSLDDRLRDGPLSLNTASRMLSQIASALTFAHEQGIVHRDLKPNNVLLDEKSNAYLTDFGIAKMLAGTTKLTATGNILGTPAYMSPEQWRGEAVDGRTDNYSLGVMLYEMVLGRLPFTGDTPYTLMYKHFNDAPPPPRQINPNLNPAVEAVILRGMAKSADERYQSADAMAEEFAEAVRALPAAIRQTPVQAVWDKTIVGEDRKGMPHQAVSPADEAATLGPTFTSPTQAASTTPPGVTVPTAPAKRGFSPVLIGVIALIVLGAIVGGIVMLTRGDKKDDGGDKVADQPTATATLTATYTEVPPTLTPTVQSATPTIPTATERATFMEIVSERSTVRSGPGSEFETLGVLTRGEQVVVVGISESGEWYQIPYAGALGWVWIETVRITGNPNIPQVSWPTATQAPTDTPEPTATETLRPSDTPTVTPELPTNTPRPPTATPQADYSAQVDPTLFNPTDFAPVDLPAIGVSLDYPTSWEPPSSSGAVYGLLPVPSDDPIANFYPIIFIARGTPNDLLTNGLSSDVSNPVVAIEHTLGFDYTGSSEAVNTLYYPAYMINRLDSNESHSWVWLVLLSENDWLYIVALAPPGDYDEAFGSETLYKMMLSLTVDGTRLAISDTLYSLVGTGILTDVPIQPGEFTFDHFDNNNNDWQFAPVSNGRLVIDAAEKDVSYWSYPTGINTFGDAAFYMQATGALVRQPDYWEYGITFRTADTNTFYYFGINYNQQYAISKLVDGTYTLLVGPNTSDLINVTGDATNTLGALVIGDYISVYINGQWVNSTLDHEIPQGDIRLAVYTYADANQTIAVAFDDFTYIPLTTAPETGIGTNTQVAVAKALLDNVMWSYPTYMADVLTALPQGTDMVVLGRTPDSNYLFGYVNGYVGWVSKENMLLSRGGIPISASDLPGIVPSLSGVAVEVWPVIWPASTTVTPPTNSTPMPTPVELTVETMTPIAPSGMLAYGESVTGTMSNEDLLYLTTWTFEGKAGDVITISVTGAANLDTSLTLLNSADEFVWSDDDGGPGVNPLIKDFTLPADDVYTIEVLAITGDGDYTLTLTKQ